MWYQTYYTAADDVPETGIPASGLPFRYGVGYAESEDGLHFTKPLLGKVAWRGQDTNMAVRGYSSPSPQTCLLDPDTPDPRRRYRLWVWDEAHHPGCHALIGMSHYASADGFDWQGLEWDDNANPDPQPFCYVKTVGNYRYPYSIGPNETNGIYWDEPSRRYVNYCRASNGSVRCIGRMESPDGIHWTQPELVAMPDLQDPFLFQFYWARPYRAGEFVILYVTTYAPAQSHQLQVQVLASRDGRHFTRVGDRQTWIAPGEPGSWNAGMVSATAPVLHDDRLWIYASGTAETHAADQTHGAIGLYHFRPDGYVSLDATDTEGSFTTRRMVWEHDELRLNFEAPHGEVRVEVLPGEAVGGQLRAPTTTFGDHYPPGLPGFAREDCVPLTGDHLSAPVRFERAKLSDLRGRYVQLRFWLRDARLFSWAVS